MCVAVVLGVLFVLGGVDLVQGVVVGVAQPLESVIQELAVGFVQVYQVCIVGGAGGGGLEVADEDDLNVGVGAERFQFLVCDELMLPGFR